MKNVLCVMAILGKSWCLLQKITSSRNPKESSEYKKKKMKQKMTLKKSGNSMEFEK